MKNVVVIAIGVMLIFVSCKNEPKAVIDADNSATALGEKFTELDTADMQTISLADYNLNLTIKVPVVETAAGSEVEPIVEHVDGDYLWYIKIGEYFNLVIEDYAKEFNKVLKHEKDFARQAKVFKVSILEKTPQLLFYKRELIDENGGIPTFHCYAEIDIEGYNYVLRTEPFGGYEPVVRDIVQSIKTAKPIK